MRWLPKNKLSLILSLIFFKKYFTVAPGERSNYLNLNKKILKVKAHRNRLKTVFVKVPYISQCIKAR